MKESSPEWQVLILGREQIKALFIVKQAIEHADGVATDNAIIEGFKECPFVRNNAIDFRFKVFFGPG